ncbi:MAG: hypothetical protein ABIQ93_07850 [Saprospiraceae bacterium]
MLTFDEFGHLIADQPIESDLAEVEAVFVFNEKRRLIFADLLAFLEELTAMGIGDFQVWIDGSFVTKKVNPKDMDCVFFLNYQVFDKNESRLRQIRNDYKLAIDSYFIPIFPENHPHFNHYNLDRVDWLFLFSRDRQRRKKGFLQLEF